jgi:tRNA G37 N-methylase Trm5
MLGLASRPNLWQSKSFYLCVRLQAHAISAIAEHVSEGAPKEKKIIIDAFAGAGGNAIAFALSGRWDQVFAIEKDPAVLKCAKHNAEIYGVDKKIWWYEGDCFEILKTRLARTKDAIIYASPPWGGEPHPLPHLALPLPPLETRGARLNFDRARIQI